MAKVTRLPNTRSVIDEYAFEETLMLDDGESELTIKFDSEIMTRILEDLELVIASRGIIANIDQNHPEVITTARRKVSQSGRSTVQMKDIIKAMNQLRTVHDPALKTARYQLMVLYILDGTDSLLEVSETKNGAKVQLQPPYDWEIPEVYWNGGKKSGTPSDIKKLAIRTASFTSSEPLPDKTNPLDVMIGFAMGALDNNPKFARECQRYFERALVCLEYGEVELDSEAMSTFRQLMAELLLDPMGGTDSDEFGEHTENGVSDGDGHPESGGDGLDTQEG